MYWKDKWDFGDSIEYEYKYAGNYGARGEKRKKKQKPTPEQIKKQNQRNKEKKVRRLIKANFEKNDIWATLKYPKGTRKPLDEVKKDIRNFLNRLRRRYRKRGQELKFIYRLEIGKQGGIHLHFLVNRIKGEDTDVVLQETWTSGRVWYENIYESGGYEKLASYIVKEVQEEEYEQLSFLEKKEKKEFSKYTPSKNLVRPKPERKNYRRWTVRKMVENGPEPTPGYYIDKNSIRAGINRFTGMTYFYYTEYKIREGDRRT